MEHRKGEMWGSETRTTSAGLSEHFGRWENQTKYYIGGTEWAGGILVLLMKTLAQFW